VALGGTALTWEQVVNLADMALYQAKARGRNCACGVLGFPDGAPATLEPIERDLEEAWRQGWVDLSVVPGDVEYTMPVRSRA
jgi:hypothetical protein